MIGDLLILRGRCLHFQLCQRQIFALDDIVYVFNIDLVAVAVSKRHVFIDLHDDLARAANDAQHIRDLRSEVKIPVAVHRSDLKHRDINVIAIVIPKLRQFAEHHRHVPAVAFVCHAAVESTEMRGSKAHMLRAFLSERRGSPIGSQRFLVDSHRR